MADQPPSASAPASTNQSYAINHTPAPPSSAPVPLSVPSGTPATPPATPPPPGSIPNWVAAEEDVPAPTSTSTNQLSSTEVKKRKTHVLVPTKKVVDEVKEPEIVLPLAGLKPKPKFKPPVRAPKPAPPPANPASPSSASLIQPTSSPLSPSSDPAPTSSLPELGPATPSQSIARKKLAKPFKVPLAPAKPKQPSPDPPSSSAFLPTSPPSTSLPPSELDGPAPAKQSAARKTLAKPFRPPLAPLNGPAPAASSGSSSTGRPGAKRGAELAALQRRAQVLRQAVKYEKAKETGGPDSEAELERLCEKWKEAGKLAIELLWAHAPKIDPTFRDAAGDGGGGGGSWGFDDGGASGGGGFASSWGFASDPAKPDDNPFTSSWGFSSATSLPSAPPEETLEDFKQRVRDEARQSERSVKAVIDELNAETLPTVDELIARAGVRRKRAAGGEGGDEGGGEGEAKRVKLEEEEGEGPDEYELEVKREEEAAAGKTEGELDEEEVERMARELMARSEAEAARAVEEGREGGDKGAEGEGQEEEEKAEEKLTLGRLMRVVGVEPGMFGWDDDLEDFV